jgi:hypothetical protein
MKHVIEISKGIINVSKRRSIILVFISTANATATAKKSKGIINVSKRRRSIIIFVFISTVTATATARRRNEVGVVA